MRSCSLGMVVAALLLWTLAGCSGQPHARVSGTVTLQGMPLKNKVVLTFVGPDQVPRSTQTDETGAFSLTDLPIGETRVTVVSIPEGGSRPQGQAAQENASSRGRLGAAPATLAEVPWEYGDAANPRLTFTLVEGDNDLPINLVLAAPVQR
jgi:hypothetical protein